MTTGLRIVLEILWKILNTFELLLVDLHWKEEKTLKVTEICSIWLETGQKHPLHHLSKRSIEECVCKQAAFNLNLLHVSNTPLQWYLNGFATMRPQADSFTTTTFYSCELPVCTISRINKEWFLSPTFLKLINLKVHQLRLFLSHNRNFLWLSRLMPNSIIFPILK